jgi:hypothetical protein
VRVLAAPGRYHYAYAHLSTGRNYAGETTPSYALAKLPKGSRKVAGPESRAAAEDSALGSAR